MITRWFFFEKRVVPRCGTEISLCGIGIPSRGTGWKSLKMESFTWKRNL